VGLIRVLGGGWMYSEWFGVKDNTPLQRLDVLRACGIVRDPPLKKAGKLQLLVDSV
jgi:hypothetical protein